MNAFFSDRPGAPGLFFCIGLTFGCVRFIMVYYERKLRSKRANTRGEDDEIDGS